MNKITVKIERCEEPKTDDASVIRGELKRFNLTSSVDASAIQHGEGKAVSNLRPRKGGNAMNEYTKEEKYEIASQIGQMLYADLDITDEEESALKKAMEIISPEYVADREKDEREAQEFFESMTNEQLAEYAKKCEAEITNERFKDGANG